MVTSTKTVTIHQPSMIITAFITNLVLIMKLNEIQEITSKFKLTIVILLEYKGTVEVINPTSHKFLNMKDFNN